MEERNGLGACRLPFRLSETRAIRRLLREWAWHYLVYPLTVSVYLERAEIKIPKRVFSHGGPCNGAVRKTRWIQNVHSHGVHREVESSDSRQGRECFEEEAKKTVKIIELLLSWSAVTVCRLFFIDSSRLLRLDNTFCIILFVDIYLLFVWDVIKKIFISYGVVVSRWRDAMTDAFASSFSLAIAKRVFLSFRVSPPVTFSTRRFPPRFLNAKVINIITFKLP